MADKKNRLATFVTAKHNFALPAREALVRQAYGSSDINLDLKGIHTLKGMLASMSCNDFSAAAFHIECMAKLSELANIPVEAQRMQINTVPTQHSLQPFCAGNTP